MSSTASTFTVSTPFSTFSVARTASRLGVHTTLLLFTALFLPRSTYVLTGTVPPEQASSRDKPQLEFLRPITAEPLWTMGWVVLGVAIVVSVWARSVEREVWEAGGGGGGARKGKGKEKEKDGVGKEGEDDEAKVRRAALSGQDRIESLKDALMGTLAVSCFFHIILVFFGAPLVDQFSKTYLLALLLSLLTVFTNAYIFKLPSFSGETSALLHRLLWLRLFIELAPRTPHERLLVYPVVGTLVGAWLGAFPIALDWDRPWQAWPLTPAYGSIVGYIVASWSALLVNAILFLAEAGKQDRINVNTQAASTTAVKVKSKKSGKKHQ